MRHRTGIVFLLAIATVTAIPALAQQVGTTTAVNPTSESTSPGSATVALKVGSRVVHKERIHTTPTGTVQLLFLDHSTLSIAPNTSLLIDEYIYNPDSGAGHMVTKLAEGALRFVGGKLSHQGEVNIDTPAVAVGIRGGTVTIKHGRNGTRVINHFGMVTMHNGCGTSNMRMGFAVTILDWNTCPAEPERVSAAEIAQYLKLLTSQIGQDGGVPGLTNVGVLQGLIDPGTIPVITDNGESDAFQIIIQATQQGTGRTPPPPPPRVIYSHGG